MLSDSTIGEIAPRLADRSITSVALVEACLDRIARRNPELNAFITVTADAALEGARDADRDIAAGRRRGPLHGIPISLKDIIDLRGTRTTAASRVRAGHPASADAPVAAALRRAGAVFVGKTNLHEFAFGTTGEDSAFGPARNPHDPSRSAGGSSSGSAAAIASGMCVASIGTDTGGSIRIPAAACGTVGLKPAFEELPCAGIVPLSRSLDHVGPLARSVGDAWILYRAMAGDANPPSLEPSSSGQRLRLGIPRRYFLDHLDDEVRAKFNETLERFEAVGFAIEEVDVRHATDIAGVYLHVVLPEAAAYHARTLESRPDDYTRPVRTRLEMGRAILAEDYIRAMRGREVLRDEVDAALDRCDALALPTLPMPPQPLGTATVRLGEATEPVRNAMLKLTQLFNLTGHPSISIPSGAMSGGLPGALQLVGRHGRTADLLSLALRCEAALAADQPFRALPRSSS